MIDGLGRGGAERILAETAPRLVRSGIDIAVVALQDRDGNPVARDLLDAGVPVEHVPVRRLRDLGALRRLVGRLRELSPDVVHAHLEFSGILGSIAGAILRVPTVVTLHTLDRPTGLDRASLRLRLMNRTLGHLAGTVICLTAQARDLALSTALGRGDLLVLANGIDLAPWRRPPKRPRAEVRAEFGIPADAPLLVAVAVLRPPKGLRHLVEAMPAILEASPRARLLIVGDGPDRAALEERSVALGLAGTVTFAGHRNDVADLMRASDVFVLPTLVDALPTVVMEAMASGLPIVASRTGGLPEMITHEVDGLLVPAGDAARIAEACGRLLRDPALARSLGLAGQETVARRFDLDRQAALLTELYLRLAARKGHPP